MPKVDQLGPAVDGDVLEALELGHRGVEADLESLNLAEPAVGAGIADAFAKILDDLDEAGLLPGVHLEDRAADAGFSELALVSAYSLRCSARYG
ncbi:hypothetical protein [Streptomyces virginiae]|uniref:hypothetical protein n=1 Tax=Streptomyces virginiae TaxID=1961 RepID=UPI0004C5D390|nr:hypothetical protein [Streptomyces virginiae]